MLESSEGQADPYPLVAPAKLDGSKVETRYTSLIVASVVNESRRWRMKPITREHTVVKMAMVVFMAGSMQSSCEVSVARDVGASLIL